MKVKKSIWTVLKILFITVIVVWMIIFVVDYFRAKSGNKPMICLKEERITTKNNAIYYRCTSFGYKYYEYSEKERTAYGFGASFVKNDIEKEIEE